MASLEPRLINVTNESERSVNLTREEKAFEKFRMNLDARSFRASHIKSRPNHFCKLQLAQDKPLGHLDYGSPPPSSNVLPSIQMALMLDSKFYASFSLRETERSSRM